MINELSPPDIGPPETLAAMDSQIHQNQRRPRTEQFQLKVGIPLPWDDEADKLDIGSLVSECHFKFFFGSTRVELRALP
jgi:hypothetical protein